MTSYFAEQNTKAYLKESRVTLCTFDVLAFLAMALLSLIADGLMLYLTIPAMIAYIFYSIMAAHKTAILERVDLKKSNIVQCDAEIIDFKQESSWGMERGYNPSRMSWLYPNSKYVQKFKLYFTDESNDKRFVRLIMSHEKVLSFYELFEKQQFPYQNYKLQLNYLKRSKILLSFSVTMIENHDTYIHSNKKRDVNIQNAVERLNTTI